MTINVERHVTTDLFEPNDSLQFNPQRAAQLSDTLPRLSAVTFTSIKTNPHQNHKDLAVACGKEAISLIRTEQGGKDFLAWLFVSDGPWKPATRIVRHQKLWKNHRDLVYSRGNMQISDEVAIEVGGQVRFAGLLEITDELTEKAIELVRVNPACAIIFSNRKAIYESDNVSYIFTKAFPKVKGSEQTSVDWMSLAIALCPQGDLLMRVSGLFDDREAAVDIIGTRENLPIV